MGVRVGEVTWRPALAGPVRPRRRLRPLPWLVAAALAWSAWVAWPARRATIDEADEGARRYLFAINLAAVAESRGDERAYRATLDRNPAYRWVTDRWEVTPDGLDRVVDEGVRRGW